MVFETKTNSGRADYLLKDEYGRVTCVLEAKSEDKDPYDAKEQARGYAENLKAAFILLSNGAEHWFWNYARKEQKDAYRIERFPSPADLRWMPLRKWKPAQLLDGPSNGASSSSHSHALTKCVDTFHKPWGKM